MQYTQLHPVVSPESPAASSSSHSAGRAVPLQRVFRACSVLSLAAALVACSGSGEEDTSPTPTQVPTDAPTETPVPEGTPTPAPQLEVPSTYTFESRFVEGSSSVAYAGQSLRHVLISDLKAHIGKLTARIDQGTFIPAEGDVLDELNFYFRFDMTTSGDVPITLSTTPSTLQSQYNQLSSSNTNLVSKVAGNDPEGQHASWATDFKGWTAEGVTTPESLIVHWFAQLEAQAINRANGTPALDPDGEPITQVYLTPEGHDLQQLLQKFLDGSITFSQGTDDYLDDDLAGKGLLADNTAAEEGKPYTALEHAWDEGFGYFGAARDYAAYTDEELSAAGGRTEYAKGYHDSSADGAIDLLGEYNFGHSVNAAKRDLESASSAPTDFSQQAIDAFLTGRAMIAAANGALSTEALDDLRAQRDLAVSAWEKAIAATVVHYINDVLTDMTTFGTESYDFAAHAKHWSEMKGFALGFQFNPASPLSDQDFVTLHSLLGMAPVLPNQSGADEYQSALLEARTLLRDAYAFADANMGDENGAGGW